MSRLWFTGGEAKDNGETTGGGNGANLVCWSTVAFTGATYDGTVARLGSGQAFKFDADQSLRALSVYTASHGTDYFLRAYIRVTGSPNGSIEILSLGFNNYNVIMSATRTLRMRSGTVAFGAESSALAVDTWYRVELRVRTSASANSSQMELLLDGTQVDVSTTVNNTTVAGDPTFGWINSGQNNGQFLYFDDLALNDSNGSAQNSWPGDGKIVLLLPTSDNARGSWVAGSAGTTSTSNLWEGLNNTPPIGTSTPLATTEGISNAISGATAPNGDFNMATYTAAGVGASDTINCVQQVICHGEDVATGTKTGTFKIFSNPDSGTADNVAAGGSNQFGPSAGGAVGTHPANWRGQGGTIVHSPSVTKSTAPVARITKTDTGTRAADLDFMGIMVDYTPAVAANVPHTWIQHYGPILAQ